MFDRKKAPCERPLARVYDKYLCESDIEALSITGLGGDDSLELVKGYVRNWVDHHLMVAYAERNLPKEKLDIEDQIENYREALLIYSYETEYLAQRLDTVVPDFQIEDYYRAHAAEFVLEEDIYRMLFIVTSRESPQSDSVKIWMRRQEPEYRSALESYAARYAARANLNDSLWFSRSELAGIFPPPFMAYVSPGNRWPVSWSDSANTYVSMVTQAEIKGKAAPLSYLRPRIRNILLLENKNRILEALRQGVETDAEKKGHYEIFVK